MRVGGSEPVPFAGRVLSASQQPAEGAESQAVRRDLLSRLNTLVVRVPPLRDYAEDVPEL